MTLQTADRKRVIVVGGGISGLVAAHRLVELDARLDVTLLEAGTRLGGVLKTVRRDGFLIEHSADNFITDPAWGVEFCQRIGFVEQLIPTSTESRGAMVVHRGRLERVPPGFMLMAPARLWPLLTTPILSPFGKLRLLGEALVPRRKTSDDESLGAFARRRLGREVFERIVQPLVGGIYTADPEKLSLRATMPRFIEMERRYGSLIRGARHERRPDQRDASRSAGGARYGLFVTPRQGLSSLIEAIAARLPEQSVRLNCPVDRVERSQDGTWRVQIASSDGAGETLVGEGLILAVPAPAAGNLIEPVDRELAAKLRQIEYAGTAIVTLAYPRNQMEHPPGGFGFVVPAVEQRRILAGSFSSVKFAGRAPQDAVLIRVFIGGACQREMLALSEAELRSIAIEELRSLIGTRGEPLFCDVIRWPDSMPQYHLGHCELVDEIEHGAKRWPGFALVGNAYHGVGIPNCIHTGELAAQRVVAGLRQDVAAR